MLFGKKDHGSSTHTLGKKQRQLGRFTNAAKRILDAHPDAKDDVMELIKVYGGLVDDVYSVFGSGESSGMPMADAIVHVIETKK